MDELKEFKYAYNYTLFKFPGHQNLGDSTREVATFLERSIRVLREVLSLESSCIVNIIASTPNFSSLLSTFVCRVLPPFSPYVIHDETHEQSRPRVLLHELTRILLGILDKVKDSTVVASLGINDYKFMVNVINLYWRNNESVICDLISSCQRFNHRFVHDLGSLTQPLLERIQSEFDHLQFLLSGIKQGRMFETSRTFESEGVFTARSDDTSAFDRNALFVDKDTVLLDSLTFLETVLRFASEDDYDYILSTTVDTSEGRVQLSPFLTNLYYLLTYFHYYMLSQTAPLYKMEPLQDRYAVMFQKCLFHRCKMLALSCLLAVVRHNVVIRPVESADYCYNWLLVFTQIGGEEYDFDRSVIEKDLRDINFLDHVDEWNSISGTWLPAELQQIKSMVSSTAKEAPVEASDDINQIKEITGITDTAVIQECLEKHDFDISNAIMDLFNAVKEQPRPLAQPAKQTIVDPSLSMRFLPKESRQAVLNYWDYVNRPELYDDDYESEDEFDGDVVPLNAKALYDDIISSDGDSDGGKDHASKENDIGSVAGPPKMTFQPKGGSARSQHKEGNATSSRGNRGRRNFNRKRNTINMDAFG